MHAMQRDSATCDEPVEYAARCSTEHHILTNALRRWRGKRGLYIEYMNGNSLWGLGHILPNLFLLFDVCMRLERYCYIRMYDMQLHTFMRYAIGPDFVWGPPDTSELRLYGLSKAQLSHGNASVGVNFNPLLSFGSALVQPPSRFASVSHFRLALTHALWEL